MDKKVEGSSVILANALQGYALAEYPDGMESAPTQLPWVDMYIQHFVDVVLPQYSANTTQASFASPPASRRPTRSRKSSGDAEFQITAPTKK